ncbi:hypothetical protein RJT34_22843 [Clitoria ternatea]|uniref:BHLH domain-containing protein n=1 Tax=Clitoria ternatea TaxID=43366 RepID=A0AAN9IKY6_CLITE
MAGNGSEGLGDDFFEQILAGPEGPIGYASTRPPPLMPLGLNLEQAAFLRHQHDVVNLDPSLLHNNNTSSSSSSNERDSMLHMRGLFSAFGQLHTPTHVQSIRPTLPSPPPPPQPQLHLHLHHHNQQAFHGGQAHAGTASMPQPPGIRPRVRARRGQATDPHSIAERLRRERIAERMKALQELVPSINKTDRAAMLDEIVDYVKFLRLQVKVLSMSRLGGAGAVAQLVADVPLSAVEGEDIEGGANEQAWDKWSNDGTEQQVAKLMEEDVGAAMQFLQSKALCIMPISLASAIFRMPQSDASTVIKPESNSHS